MSARALDIALWPRTGVPAETLSGFLLGKSSENHRKIIGNPRTKWRFAGEINQHLDMCNHVYTCVMFRRV